MSDQAKPWDWLQIPPPHLAEYADGVWRDVTIADLAEQRAAEDPDFVAVIDNRRSMTRKQLLDDARALAAALMARGLVPGDVVSFQLPNWHEAAVFNLAAAMAGFVVNPIVPIYRDAEVRQMLGDCRARAILTCTEFRRFDFSQMALRLRDELPDLEFAFTARGSGPDDYETLVEEGRSLPFDRPQVDPHGVKMVLYTSGTTGRPKGVLHSHATIERIKRLSSEYWGIGEGEATIMPSPVTHISGYANGLEAPFVTGDKCIFMESWNAEDALRLIEEHEVVATVAATPFLVELANAARAAGTRLPSMRVFACGGAAVPPDLIPAANSAFDNLQAFRVFGASEVPLVTFGWMDNEELAATTDGEVVDYQVMIVDDDGAELPFGQEGEILARGPAMMLGYADKSQAEAAITPDGYFRTGDLGTLSENGAITVTGRKKDLIIRGGENISAVEIEDVLRTHPQVRDASVVAMPHERLGEGVCAYIISEGDPASVEMLCKHVQATGLAKQKTPERFEFVDDYPRTASGKIRKDMLRADIKSKIESEAGADA
ncbi:cyclohexanecarboxylate-CoA ligase [Novosphingobium marinum]|uniref:Acyl-CoA synthetase (AMP-forming)/AMP-acid ligase II n=1 Tax=Novosphingobium marinum TaxID=1514948 RepID=A0A7Z0BTZ7_9SPHN|nr:AMP-binding protein [Novosphingobium marinum]NYH93785.1 acyl-CoA synthetase (AMP-forming)/AMP-acid ligase II [Novosphingobium marinum]GGC17261.1 cyclohexanecarboxylate-CoA ligase [Novosphingobium marinum]